MTPDELRRLLSSNQGPLAFADALLELDETTRKKLSKPVQEVYRAVRKEEQADWGRTSHRGSLTRLAILACCPWSQAKRVHGRSWQLHSASHHWSLAVIKILTQRRPDWATDWVNLQLENPETAWACVLSWQQIRDLVRGGVIERPTADGYAHLMIAIPQEKYASLIDAEFLESDLWRLFEVQTFAFQELRPVKEIDRDAWAARINDPTKLIDNRWIGGGGWPRLVYHLAANGRIDRGRLIKAILGAFWRDFNNSFFSAMVRFHDLLEPTDDEIAAHQELYRELLRCDYGPAVGLAIKSLARLHQVKRLDVAEFLQAAPGAFSISSKTQPAAALSLIQRVAAPPHHAAAVNAVAPALNHESPDIQEKGVKILAKWKAADESLDISPAIVSATMIAPQHRKTLERLSAIAVDGVTATPTDQETPLMSTDLDQREKRVIDRAAALPQWVSENCQLRELGATLAAGDLPEPFDPPATCPVLSGVEPIQPINDVDELIDVAAQVIARAAEPEDAERVIDAIFRIGEQRSDNFDAKSEGLRTVVQKHLDSLVNAHGTATMWQMHALPLMIGKWLGIPGVSQVTQTCSSKKGSLGLAANLRHVLSTADIDAMMRQATIAMTESLTPLDWKFAELFERLDRGQHGPVLSTPTHKSGWIDARVFVDRIRNLTAQGVEIGERDFIGGLLRLAPDFRQQTLVAAADLADPHGRIVRYALGGSEQPTKKDRRTADLWLAAGRARDPRGVLNDLTILKLSPDEPDGITPARYSLNRQIDPTELKYSRFTLGHGARGIEVTPNRPGKGCRESRPAVALAARLLTSNRSMFFEDSQQFQLSSIAPANTDATLAAAANQLLCRIDDKGSVFEPVAGLMSPLLVTDRGWSKIARIVLWLGLLSRDDQARGIAIDALIDGINDGRADAGRMSATLLDVAGGGWIKLNRLADSLREVTRTSVLAERVIAEMLDPLIACWGSLPRDGHHVLGLQLELLTNLEGSLSNQAQRVLSVVKGSGKAARLARQLCSLVSEQGSSKMRLAAIEAAEGRLARAERIANYIGERAKS